MLAPLGKRSYELLDYLIQTCPMAIEKKSPAGETPLMVACRLGRRQYVNLLIDGNADQSTRNSVGENIVHAAVSKARSMHRLRALLDELDADLRASLFLQRKNLSDNGQTPLQLWISTVSAPDANYNYSSASDAIKAREKGKIELLQLLLDYADGQGLDLLDSTGDTSLHNTVMREEIALTTALIDFKPALLYRENAVGRTPAEIAEDLLKAKPLSRPMQFRSHHNRSSQNHGQQMASRDAREYKNDMKKKSSTRNQPADKSRIEALGLSGDYTIAELSTIYQVLGLDGDDNPPSHTHLQSFNNKNSPLAKRVIWDLCATAMRKHPSPRRLVSLNEANDVARRLGDMQPASRVFSIHSRHAAEDDDDAEKEEKAEENVGASLLVQPNAWQSFKEDVGKQMELDQCDVCKHYHD